MTSLLQVFGAKARINLKHEGDIRSLAAKLSKGLILPDFKIETREDPPHDVVGSLEVMAWEMWLERDTSIDSFHYSLSMETEDCLEEISRRQMHDISPWLARFVSKICRIDSLVSGTRIAFVDGKQEELG